jgi:hypothetical protein
MKMFNITSHQENENQNPMRYNFIIRMANMGGKLTWKSVGKDMAKWVPQTLLMGM